jgi:ubiquinol-cytochrome c reductase cytochrome c1 subunit
MLFWLMRKNGTGIQLLNRLNEGANSRKSIMLFSYIAKKIGTLAVAGGLAMFAMSGAVMAAEEDAIPHYPLLHPKQQSWSFAGPFGHWNIPQLQRGLQIYTEVCSACHALEYVAFRNLAALGYSEAQVRGFAADYSVEDGPNGEGEMFERAALPSDRFPPPYPNEAAAAYANNGAAPPDLSLIAKARAPERGFPWFVFDVFTLYAENGPDYIYSLLSGYQEPPAGEEVPEGTHYNPYFVSGSALAMAPPLSDGIVSYSDGSPETVEQYSRDISAFLMWAAEPHLVERKSMGLKVLMFLVIFAVLLYLVKQKVWAGLKTRDQTA